MIFPNEYKCLTKSSIKIGMYKIIPIRYEDRLDIMRWRNDQLYHLRQDKPLTEKNQDSYFNDIVLNLFNKEQPSQLLFSFLENDKCIGYGGLVHINWIDKNAEISFVMDTFLEKSSFDKYWNTYLLLIEKLAFDDLKLHKLFVYAFDLRPHLYKVLENANYINDARLTEHCFFNNQFLDVVIYSKLNV